MHEELHALAKNGLREIAVRGLASRGLRMDGRILSGWAMRLFHCRPLEKVWEITFEIGMLGQHGLDESDSKETHVLRALPGRAFSALELLCIMHAKFKQIELGMDIGVDLGEVWGMAERLERSMSKS